MVKHLGLLAPSIGTRGGVQSFMLRIAEVIAGAVDTSNGVKGYCISLNDRMEDVREHQAMSEMAAALGASGSKIKFIALAFAKLPKTDVLFVGHIGLSPVAYLLKLFGRVKKYYVILHGIEAWKRIPYLDRLALLSADSLIATTQYTAEECARFNKIPHELFKVIPLCADERNVAPSRKLRLAGGLRLLCVARLDSTERFKGFEQIFHALVALKTMYPKIHLNIVGKGDDQVRLRNVADGLGVGDLVTFWGALSDEDLAAAYLGCDVFVMPSKKEGFGIVFLEAMRYGKPCIEVPPVLVPRAL